MSFKRKISEFSVGGACYGLDDLLCWWSRSGRTGSAGLVWEAAPKTQGRFHPDAAPSLQPPLPPQRTAPWKECSGGRRFPPLHSTSGGQVTSPGLPDSRDRRRSLCAREPRLPSPTRGPPSPPLLVPPWSDRPPTRGLHDGARCATGGLVASRVPLGSLWLPGAVDGLWWPATTAP